MASCVGRYHWGQILVETHKQTDGTFYDGYKCLNARLNFGEARGHLLLASLKYFYSTSMSPL